RLRPRAVRRGARGDPPRPKAHGAGARAGGTRAHPPEVRRWRAGGRRVPGPGAPARPRSPPRGAPAPVDALRPGAPSPAAPPAARGGELLEAYEFLRQLLRSLRLAQARPADCLPMTGHVLARLAREAGVDGGRALLARQRQVAEFVRREYLRIVGALGARGEAV